MTLTKNQKLRRAMERKTELAVPMKVSMKRRKAARGLSRKDLNFLNGNSFSFLNTSAAVGKQGVSRINAPVSKGFSGLSSRAKITTSSGVTRVQHSEYVSDIFGDIGFEAVSEPINPGNEGLFPWLSSVARRYESYQFRGLTFRYETTSSTGTNGTVILTVDYNPNGTVPNSKVEALAMESAVRSPVWNRINHTSLVHNLTKRKTYYIRNGDAPVQDVDLYDTGLFVVMTEGVPSETGTIGELYVDYEVDLITPILTLASLVSQGGTIVEADSSTDSGRFPWETDLTYDPSNNRNAFFAGPGVNVVSTEGTSGVTIGAIVFQFPGTYLLNYEWTKEGLVGFDGASFVLGFEGLGSSSFINITPGGELGMVSDSDINVAMSLIAVKFTEGQKPSNGFRIGVAYNGAVAGLMHTKLIITSFGQTSIFDTLFNTSNLKHNFNHHRLVRQKRNQERKERLQSPVIDQTMKLHKIEEVIAQRALQRQIDEMTRKIDDLKLESHPESSRDAELVIKEIEEFVKILRASLDPLPLAQ